MSTEYERAVERYLADAYGVTRIEKGFGGRHPQWRFTHGGREHVLIMQAAAHRRVREGNGRSVVLKLQDIRRKLGPPAKLAESAKLGYDGAVEEQENEMIEAKPALPASPPTPQPKRWDVGVATYRNSVSPNASLRLNLPQELVDAFGQPLAVEVLGDEDLKITVDQRGATPKAPKTSRADERVLCWVVPDVARPFGRSPAEAVVVDDAILVHCPLATRRWLSDAPAAARPKPAETKPSATEPSMPSVTHNDVADATACLAELRRIEAETPYRLMREKDGGDWIFVAPRIR